MLFPKGAGETDFFFFFARISQDFNVKRSTAILLRGLFRVRKYAMQTLKLVIFLRRQGRIGVWASSIQTKNMERYSTILLTMEKLSTILLMIKSVKYSVEFIQSGYWMYESLKTS